MGASSRLAKPSLRGYNSSRQTHVREKTSSLSCNCSQTYYRYPVHGTGTGGKQL